MSNDTIDYASMNQTDILNFRRKVNEQLGGQYYTTGKGKKKDEMVAEMTSNAKLNTSGLAPVTKTSHKYVTLTLADIGIHPLNMRGELDYLDPTFDDRIEVSGSLTKDPVVSSRKIKREDGTFYHPIVAGNRSVEALRRVVSERWGQDAATHEIQVKMKDYGPDIQAAIAQEIVDLQVDNDTHMTPSAIDQLKMLRHYEMLGFDTDKIVSTMGKSPAQISILRSLDALPDRYKALVDAGMKTEFYSNIPRSVLDAHRIPYTIDADTGLLRVTGIKYNKARAATRYLPPSSLSRTSPDEFELKLKAAHELLMSDEVLVAALDKSVTSKQFEDVLSNAAQKIGGHLPDLTTSKSKNSARSIADVIADDPDDANTGDAQAPVSNPIADRLAKAAAAQAQAQTDAPAPTNVLGQQGKPSVQSVSKPVNGDETPISSEVAFSRALATFEKASGATFDDFCHAVSDGGVVVSAEVGDNVISDASAPALSKADTAQLLLFMLENGLIDIIAKDDVSVKKAMTKITTAPDPSTVKAIGSMLQRAWIDFSEE
jgi:hypothetical protein